MSAREQLLDLPPALLLHCLSFLDGRDVAAAALTCRALASLSREEALWHALFLRAWDEPYDSAVRAWRQQNGQHTWRREFVARAVLLQTLATWPLSNSCDSRADALTTLFSVLASSAACNRTRATLTTDGQFSMAWCNATFSQHARLFRSAVESRAERSATFARAHAALGAVLLRLLYDDDATGGPLGALLEFTAYTLDEHTTPLFFAPLMAIKTKSLPHALVPAAGAWPAGARPPHDSAARRARREARLEAGPALLTGSWRGVHMKTKAARHVLPLAEPQVLPLRVALCVDASGTLTGWGSDALGTFRLRGSVALAAAASGLMLCHETVLEMEYGECGGIDAVFIARVVPGAGPQRWRGYVWPWGIVGAWEESAPPANWMNVHAGEFGAGLGSVGTFMLWPSE